MAGTIIFVRHGQVADEFAGRYIGATDALLGEAGIAQAEVLKRAIGECGATRFLSSPATRCIETARLAGIEVERLEIRDDLSEIYFGDWEMMTFEEVANEWPCLVEQWAEFDTKFSFLDGEPIWHFISRVTDEAKYLDELEDDYVVVFTHGGVIRFMICHYLGIEMSNYLGFDVGPGSITMIRQKDGRGVLSGLLNQKS